MGGCDINNWDPKCGIKTENDDGTTTTTFPSGASTTTDSDGQVVDSTPAKPTPHVSVSVGSCHARCSVSVSSIGVYANPYATTYVGQGDTAGCGLLGWRCVDDLLIDGTGYVASHPESLPVVGSLFMPFRFTRTSRTCSDGETSATCYEGTSPVGLGLRALGFSAITVGHTVICDGTCSQERINHEMVHVRQEGSRWTHLRRSVLLPRCHPRILRNRLRARGVPDRRYLLIRFLLPLVLALALASCVDRFVDVEVLNPCAGEVAVRYGPALSHPTRNKPRACLGTSFSHLR